MRYIHNESFIQHNGKPMTLEDAERGIPEHEATVAEVLDTALRIYDVNHNRFVREGQLLSPTEIRSFNNLMDALDRAQRGQYIAIESQDYKLLEKVVSWTVTTSPIWRDAPLIQELLVKAPDRLPTEVLEKARKADEVKS